MLAPGLHAICGCGRTGSPPICDASHGAHGGPVIHRVEGPHQNVAWCTCGGSGKLPYCDGSHTRQWPEFREAAGET